mmetsp:Transcript_17101/g.44531  ORF Transcript_17101/g.44531 Transcript_17101/m.44531 type:complete len:265 (+) Transcript_17101:848-1642(+)
MLLWAFEVSVPFHSAIIVADSIAELNTHTRRPRDMVHTNKPNGALTVRINMNCVTNDKMRTRSCHARARVVCWRFRFYVVRLSLPCRPTCLLVAAVSAAAKERRDKGAIRRRRLEKLNWPSLGQRRLGKPSNHIHRLSRAEAERPTTNRQDTILVQCQLVVCGTTLEGNRDDVMATTGPHQKASIRAVAIRLKEVLGLCFLAIPPMEVYRLWHRRLGPPIAHFAATHNLRVAWGFGEPHTYDPTVIDSSHTQRKVLSVSWCPIP